MWLPGDQLAVQVRAHGAHKESNLAVAPPAFGPHVALSAEQLRQTQDELQTPRAGLEPATKRLTAAHSTIELPGNECLSAAT